jgi:hypothetical protein
MILRLVKRDPVWLAALMLAVLIGAVAPFFAFDSLEFVTMGGLGCLLYARPHVRATLFEAALPITGRDLFLARALSLLAVVWLPALCGVTTILLVRADSPRALAMVEAAAILTAAILLPKTIRVREIAGPQGLSRVVCVLVCAVGGLAWHFLTPGIVLGVFGLAGAGILVGTWLAVPPSFQVVSLQTVDPIAVPESVSTAPLSRMAFTWLPVLRSAFWWVPIVYFCLMVSLGKERDGFLLAFMFTVFGTVQSRQRTGWLAALPLSCRARLWITLAYATIPLLAGLAVGMCISPSRLDNPMAAGPGPRTDESVNVSLEFWHYAPGVRVPVIRAPWGEAVQPVTFRAAGFTFYNPYSVGPSHSQQFLEWQFGRATEAVYGRSIPLAQYGAAYKPGLKPLTDRPRMRILIWEAVALCSLFLVFVTELTKWHLLQRLSATVRAILGWTVLGLPAVAIYGIGLFHHGYSLSICQSLFHFVLLRVTGTLPNSLLAMTVAAVTVCAMYWLLERQFGKSELTMRKQPGQPE